MKLFQERLAHQWRTYIGLCKQHVDLTMMFYVVAFLGAASFYFVRETIIEGHFGMFAHLPELLLILVFFIYCMSLRPQTMTQEADLLFLLRSPLYSGMKRSAFMYSFVMHIVYQAVALSVLAILLVPLHHYTFATFVQLLVIGIALSLVATLLSVAIRSTYIRAVCYVVLLAVMTYCSVLSLLYTMLASVALIVGAVALYEWLVVRSNRYFMKLAERERAHQFRWQSRLFMVSAQLREVKPNWHSHKRPRTMKKLYGASPEGALQELLMKTLWRNSKYHAQFFQMLTLSLFGLYMLPEWAGYMLAVLLWVALLTFTEAVMDQLKEHKLFTLLPYTDTQWFTAYKNIKYKLTLPIPLLYLLLSIWI